MMMTTKGPQDRTTWRGSRPLQPKRCADAAPLPKQIVHGKCSHVALGGELVQQAFDARRVGHLVLFCQIFQTIKRRRSQHSTAAWHEPMVLG